MSRDITLPGPSPAPDPGARAEDSASDGPGPDRRRTGRRARLAAAAVAALAALAAAAGLAGVLGVPDPAPADTRADSFSAGRAAATVEEISRAPHPAGSTANARVRDRLVTELRALGLRTQVRPAVSADTGSGAAMVARVQNVYATLPGTAPTGRVLIVAHYDSADVSPGASDDGIGVATLVETARALTEGPAPRNDIGFLLTDAEEPGLMGARGFTADGGLGDPENTVVLNLEARGTSGPVVMFETGRHAGALLPALTDRVPVATSLAAAVYEILPQDSDFTAFREAGATGLNFAVLDGSARYHTPLDSAANADRGSLQDMGAVVLAATGKLASSDLSRVREGSDATWFTLPGMLVRYPAWLVPVPPLLAASWLTVLLVLGRRRGTVRPKAVAAVAAGVPVPLLLAAVVGYAGWEVMTLVRPHYAGFSLGDPYRGGPLVLGLVLVAVGTVPLFALWARRRARTAVETALGVLAWYTLLALVTAFAVPGASYLFAWPALIGVAGVAVALRQPGDGPWTPALCALALVPAAALVVPVGVLLFSAVGLALALVPLVLVVLAVLLAAPLLSAVRRTPQGPQGVEGNPARSGLPARLGRAAMLAAGPVLGMALVAGGLVADGVDAAHPAQVSLLYTLDADTGRARWASTGEGTHSWADRLVDRERTDLEDGFPNLVLPRWRTGAAPAARVPLPTAEVLSTDRSGDTRTVRLRLGAEAGRAARLMLYADTTGARVTGARVGDVRVPGGVNRPTATGPWKWGLIQVAPPADGVEVTLTVRGTGPLKLRLVAQSPGLPSTALGRKPATVSWSADWSALTLVSRALTV